MRPILLTVLVETPILVQAGRDTFLIICDVGDMLGIGQQLA